MNKVWILIADDMSAAQVAGVAAKTGVPFEALVFGGADRAAAAAAYGAEKVVLFDTADVLAEAMAPAIAERALQEAPAAIISSDNATARAIACAIAVKLSAAVATSVVSVKVGDEGNVVEHFVADAAAVEVLRTSAPVVCIVADGGEEAECTEAAEVAVGDAAALDTLSVLSTDCEAGDANGLLNAEKVVGAGLGIGPKENLALVEDLAEALGAEIACTLPLCDNYHWFEHSRVVGTSTQKISPRLYLTVGSSGAPQHMTGVRGAKVIVAINNDPEAPIFRECAYGVLGDAKEVLPTLTAAVKSV